jgi:ABC-2 type transport system ATP-binding protein
MHSPVLKIAHLSKKYGDRVVLDNLNLAIAPGEIYGLLGPNGAGKTTTINLLCHLLQPDSGTIEIAGQPLSEATKQLLGVSPQEPLLYRQLTSAENLDFFASLYGLRGRQKQQRISACLAAVQLVEQAQQRVETLSGGMQRRLSLAIALIHQPQLLVLDEPTTGLDIEARYHLWELIRHLQSQGITILLTTHLLDEAERLCQRIGILKQGKIVAEGSLAQLQSLMAAQEIILLQTPDEAAAIARAQALGFSTRRYQGDLAFCLPQTMELREVLAQFDGIPINGVTRQPIRLEHIYLEVTQNLASLPLASLNPMSTEPEGHPER